MAGGGGVDAKLVVLVSTVVRPIPRIRTSADPRTEGPVSLTKWVPRRILFEVYMGGVDYPPDAPPVRRYMAKDALNAPHVTAVEKFKNAIQQKP
jgi:hypothetical protein